MNRIQFQSIQSKQSISKFFQQFGTKALFAAILEKKREPQNFFGGSHYGEIALWFGQDQTHNSFQCPTCRHHTSLILGALLQSAKLSLTLWFMDIYLIRQDRTDLSAMALKCQLCVSYLSAWFFKFQLTLAKAGREELYALSRFVKAYNAYLSSELSRCNADGGFDDKLCFNVAVLLSDWEHPLDVKLTPVPFIADWAKCNLSPGCAMLSDGLACFGAVTDAWLRSAEASC